MDITNKLKFKDCLINNINKKEIYLEMYSCFLDIICYFPDIHNATQFTVTRLVENTDDRYTFKLDLTVPEIKNLKKYLDLKNTKLNIKNNFINGYNTKKDVPILESEINVPLLHYESLPDYSGLATNYTDIGVLEMDLGILELKDIPESIETIYEFEAFSLFPSVYINSNYLKSIHKYFKNVDFVEVSYNATENIILLENKDYFKEMYIKCVEKVNND